MPNMRSIPASGLRSTYADFDPLPPSVLDGGGGMAVTPWRLGAHEHEAGDCLRFIYTHPSSTVDFALALFMPEHLFDAIEVVAYDVDENDWDVHVLVMRGYAHLCAYS